MIELASFLGLAALFCFACISILHMNSKAEWPRLFYDEIPAGSNKSSGDSFVSRILQHAPILNKPYIPPLIWGRSGHLQTIIHSTIGRTLVNKEKTDSRHEVILSDGSLLTFDLFQPMQRKNRRKSEETSLDVTIVVCPGIGSSSETVTMRSFSQLANETGYRVAILNHLGVIPTIPLTTPRIFSYGSTEEFGAMVGRVKEMFPKTQLLAVGFSMGANIVCKYLGEDEANRKQFIGGVSACQGYDVARCFKVTDTWARLGRCYNRALMVTILKVLHQFKDVLLTDEVLNKYGLSRDNLWLAHRTIDELDEILLAKLHGFGSRDEYYKMCSSSNYIPQIQDFPMLFINSRDDPLLPEMLFDVPRQNLQVNEKAMFCVTKHGGHLGFFECQPGHRFFHRGTYSWLDKSIIEWAQALLTVAALTGPASLKSSESVAVKEDGTDSENN